MPASTRRPHAGIRFDPPPIELDDDLRWLLLHAFGHEGGSICPSVPSRAVELCILFSMAPRIVGRGSPELLQQDLGAERAATLAARGRAAAFQALQSEASARKVAEIAAQRAVPVVFLKFMALRLTGKVEQGGRHVSDLDLLVPDDRAPEFHGVLKEHGFKTTGMPAYEHHLPALVHTEVGMVEIHKVLLGVHVQGDRRRSATYAALKRRGALVQRRELPGDCNTLDSEVQLAHTLAHGIAQHGNSPGAYPMMQMVADLIDLDFPAIEKDILARVAELLAGTVSRSELAATRALTQSLVAGELPPPDSGASLLLSHILAGKLSEDYVRSLRIHAAGRVLTDRAALPAFFHRLGAAVYPTRAQIAAIYGEPRTELGYLVRRILRPFDLIVRFCRHWWNWLRRPKTSES